MTLITRLRGVATLCTGLFWSLAVRAELPKVTGGTNGTNVMEDVKNMSRDGVNYGALVICALAFIVVVISCVSTYHKIGDGKASWFDFGARVIVGAIMVVVAIYFLNKAVTVI